MTREVDLCEECAQALAAVATFAAEHGRTVQPQQQRPGSASKVAASESVPPSSSKVAGTSGPSVSCPVEGCSAVVGAKNLGRHVRQVHGQRLADYQTASAAGDAQAYPCPDCDRTFARPQSLGAHRYQAHGYESPTREARARAAS
jgi:uncharacterized C2H2 Zn-finger protein